MKILEIKGNSYQKIIKESSDCLKNGGLLLFPSDTVYILAVDPCNQKAVKKLLDFKNRWTGKAISVAVLDIDMANEYVSLDNNALNIYSNLLPGPFTIVSRGKHKVSPGIEAENGTLCIRIPDNQWIHDLVKSFGGPITATSANLSGRTPSYSVASFLRPLSKKKKEMVDLIIDGGKLPRNKPSTVIDITTSDLKILRSGDLVTKNNKTFISKSEKETEKIAEFIYQKYKNKAVIFALSGDLGCGKTVFSRKIGKLMGVKERITSPTFVIYNEYKIKKGKFLHFDLYKINESYELDEINFFNLFKNNISCIEWPENMGEKNLNKLKKENEVVTIQFKYVNERTREIKY